MLKVTKAFGLLCPTRMRRGGTVVEGMEDIEIGRAAYGSQNIVRVDS